MGTLALVLAPASTVLRPKAVLARTADSTISVSAAVRPPGRSPTSLVDALSVFTPQRAFSSVTALSTAASTCFSVASSGAISSERISTAIRASGAMVLTDVPPPTVPTVKVVLGLLGVRISAILAMARPMPWMALGTSPNAA